MLLSFAQAHAHGEDSGRTIFKDIVEIRNAPLRMGLLQVEETARTAENLVAEIT